MPRPRSQMRHKRVDVASYLLWVTTKPSSRGKSKLAYYSAIGECARAEIAAPVEACDIELEVLYSTNASKGVRSDVDNILKPTLDALKGIAYFDDNQVRSVTATLFDRNRLGTMAGVVEHLDGLFYHNHQHVILIALYSDSRLAQLGGAEAVIKKRGAPQESMYYGSARVKKVTPIDPR